MTDAPRLSSPTTGDAHLKRIITGLFNPMPDGHPKGCLANENGPCICGYAKVAGEYLWALREAKKIAAEHFGQEAVDKSRRLEEPHALVKAALTLGDAQKPTVPRYVWPDGCVSPPAKLREILVIKMLATDQDALPFSDYGPETQQRYLRMADAVIEAIQRGEYRELPPLNDSHRAPSFPSTATSGDAHG